MTRINTVPPKQLTDQHLVGEYNEIRRPVKLAINKYNKIGIKGIQQIQPEHYKLGSGHVLFFYDKLRYLYNRFVAIVREMRNRDMNPTGSFDISDIPSELFNDWTPRVVDHLVLSERLLEKIESSHIQWRYCKKPIDLEGARRLLGL